MYGLRASRCFVPSLSNARQQQMPSMVLRGTEPPTSTRADALPTTLRRQSSMFDPNIGTMRYAIFGVHRFDMAGLVFEATH